jgi:hypothetical protein
MLLSSPRSNMEDNRQSLSAKVTRALQKKHNRQRKDRRSKTLFQKACQLSELTPADVFVGIRFRDTGRIMTFCADETGIWSSNMSYLVYHLLSSRSTGANTDRTTISLFLNRKREVILSKRRNDARTPKTKMAVQGKMRLIKNKPAPLWQAI